MPNTPFSGVRNSWLIIAKKADLASLAASRAAALRVLETTIAYT